MCFVFSWKTVLSAMVGPKLSKDIIGASAHQDLSHQGGITPEQSRM